MSAAQDPRLGAWEPLHRELLVDAPPWLQLWREAVRLPDGQVIDDFYTIEQPDYAVVFALTDARQVVAIWHYKYGPRRVHLSLPAGYVAEGEDALAAAQRELLEETGYAAAAWQALGAYTVDGNRGYGRAHLFLAQGARAVAAPDPGDHEAIRVELVDPRDLGQHLQGNVATLGIAAAIGLAMMAIREQEAAS